LHFQHIAGDFDADDSGTKVGREKNTYVKKQHDKWLKCEVGSQTIEVQILAPPLPSCEALGKDLNHCLLQFP
jgi:hypothetical protein